MESLSLWPQVDLLQEHLIQDVPPPSSEACAMWPFGDMCARHRDCTSADVFAHPQLWLEKRDGWERQCYQHVEQGHARQMVYDILI